MIRKLFDASRLALVCAALAMFVVSGPLRHAAHFEIAHTAAAGPPSALAEHGHTHDSADNITAALLIFLHGHGSDHDDHDHSTPLITAPAAAALTDWLRSTESIDEAAYAGREPLSPKPPPRG